MTARDETFSCSEPFKPFLCLAKSQPSLAQFSPSLFSPRPPGLHSLITRLCLLPLLIPLHRGKHPEVTGTPNCSQSCTTSLFSSDWQLALLEREMRWWFCFDIYLLFFLTSQKFWLCNEGSSALFSLLAATSIATVGVKPPLPHWLPLRRQQRLAPTHCHLFLRLLLLQ